MNDLDRGEGMTEGTRVRLRTVTQWLHLSVMAGLVGATILIRLGLFPYLDDQAGRVPAEVGPEIVDRWFSVFPWIGSLDPMAIITNRRKSAGDRPCLANPSAKFAQMDLLARRI